jgi:UrcA family protein
MSRKLAGVVTALSFATLAAPAALAQEAPLEIVIDVRHDDLDLSKPADGQALLGRISAAARKVCRQTAPPTSVVRSPLKCRHASIEAAVRRVDVDTLTLAWDEK